MFPGAKVRVDHSWAEAMDYMASPVDAWNMGTARASHGKRGSGDFYAMPTFVAARDAMARGWADGRRRVEAAMSGAVAGVAQHRIPAFRLDVAGSRPNVPVAVAGDPRCMYRRRPEVALSRPVVEVLCHIGSTWHVKPEHLARRGAAMADGRWQMAAACGGSRYKKSDATTIRPGFRQDPPIRAIFSQAWTDVIHRKASYARAAASALLMSQITRCPPVMLGAEGCGL